MKLFKSLLVAPAALGLLAPMTATANELNLNDVSGYSSSEEVQNISEFNSTDLAVTNSRVDGLEARFNNYEAGSFSSTTSASFSVDMAIGSVDGNTTSEAVGTAYGYQIDLTTSFTGEDSLDVAIKAGSGAGALSELDINADVGDGLAVDGISYTFPLGDKTTVLVGDKVDASSLYNKACVYGGFTNTLDDCGTTFTSLEKPETGGTALSASYDIGNGFTGAIGYAGQGTTNGLVNKESTDYYGAQIAYVADNYGVSVSYANLEDIVTTSPTTGATAWGLNAYYTFDDSSLPSFSAGYEMGDTESADVKDTSQWFVGLQWDEVGPGSLGIAAGSKGAIVDGGTENNAYEAFYSYPVNDGMTITPAVFLLENNGIGETDETGVVVKTSFSF